MKRKTQNKTAAVDKLNKALSLYSLVLLVGCGNTKIEFSGRSAISKKAVTPIAEQAAMSTNDASKANEALPSVKKAIAVQKVQVSHSQIQPTAAPAPTAIPGGASASPIVYPPPVAKLKGVPQGVSSVDKLSISVGGIGIAGYKYTIASAGKTCNEGNYSTIIAASKPIEDDLSSMTDGTITVCVKAVSEDGTVQSDASKVSFTKDTAKGIASIIGSPSGYSNQTKLNFQIGGNGVEEYLYALGIDCNTANYGTAKKISDFPKITDDISEQPDGPIKLCVKGIFKDTASQQNKTQDAASFVTWVKDTQRPIAKILGVPSGDSAVENLVLSFEDAFQYRFAVESGEGCKATSYSELRSGPLTVDVSKLIDGPTTLCVTAVDAAGNAQAQPTTHTWNKVGPGGVSLAGVPAGESDVVKLKVEVKTTSSKYLYSLQEGDSCHGALYGNEKASSNPIEDDISSMAEGKITLCVQTKVDNKTYVSSSTWTKATLPKPPVVIKGVPTGESNAMSLSALVVSKDAIGYRYTVASGETLCKIEDASSMQDINEFIQESLVDFPMGPMTLCVWGIDKASKHFGPTVAKWSKQLARCEGGIASGTEVERTRFKTDVVAWNEQCSESEKQKAVCDNGYLSWSGSFRFDTCKIATPESCKVNETVVAHNTSKDFFTTSVDVNCSAKKQTRQCVNGTLSGDSSFDKPSCDIPRCDGKAYGESQSRTRYSTNSPVGSCSSVAETQTRTCQTNETWTAWTGSFTSTTCNTGCAASDLKHGESKDFYLQSQAYGCSAQKRTCNNGVLSGSSSYQFESCTNLQICSPYQSYGCSGQQVRTCNSNGSDYTYSLVNGQCGYVQYASCSQWGIYAAHGGTAVSNAVAEVDANGCWYTNTFYCNNGNFQLISAVPNCPASCSQWGISAPHGQNAVSYAVGEKDAWGCWYTNTFYCNNGNFQLVSQYRNCP